MQSREKFYRLALNIINYPYTKRVCFYNNETENIQILPYGHRQYVIILHNSKPMKIAWDFIDVIGLCDEDEVAFQFLDDLISYIKDHFDKKVSEALLDGIE